MPHLRPAHRGRPAILDDVPAAALVDTVYERSEGKPFLTEEILEGCHRCSGSGNADWDGCAVGDPMQDAHSDRRIEPGAV